jgi:threonine/homoserine/homoserine lactone efflux protein
MNLVWLGPIAIYAIVTAFTPGPNNMMLLSSGTNFGFRRTIPHMFGITAGVFALQMALGLGLGEVFKLLPWLYLILRVASLLYLLYLAYKIATSGTPSGGDDKPRAKPMTFFGALAFQVINPKLIIVSIGFLSAYLPANPPMPKLLAGVLVNTVVGYLSTVAWAGLGVVVNKFLQQPRAIRVFNWTMAILLVASMVPVLFEG